LNIHRVGVGRQTEIHIAELLVPHPSPFEAEIATSKLQRYKSPGSVQITAEMIEADGAILWSEIHNCITSI
jgi:hypothetical protein